MYDRCLYLLLTLLDLLFQPVWELYFCYSSLLNLKLHPVISMMISAIVIGIGAGMPLNLIAETVQKGVGKTLQGIALLIGLGSMFGGILEVSGGAQKMAQTLISKIRSEKSRPSFRTYRTCNWYHRIF